MARLLVIAFFAVFGAGSLAACGSQTGTVEHIQSGEPARLPGPTSSQNGHWDDAGRPVNGGPRGADGTTGNNLTQEHCAQNEDPRCPAGSYVAPNAIRSPDGTGRYIPCEGAVCANPDSGLNPGAGGRPGN